MSRDRRGARDQEQVVDTRTVALGLGIVGIEGFDAVDHVPKAEELRGRGPTVADQTPASSLVILILRRQANCR